MSTPPGDNEFFVEFETEVRAELDLVESSEAERAAGQPVTEWLFDPGDAEREQVELRNLLGAAEELQADDSRDETL
ncbi:hypothetical protein [Actinomadura sp. WMMA1423]|uniref:hypothetical protein n=1 Tax=Actinomadura sp. WMMA1423 TaxID=2591108 RepID=UPI0011467B0F|nr:hypothetical protein [Actinomadura sp. WMMA1423]